MDQNTETVLYIISSLMNETQTVTTQAVADSMAWAAAGMEYSHVFTWLEDNGYVTLADHRLKLTQKGAQEAGRIREVKIQEEFDGLIGRCTQSSAYLDFCEELYGYRLYLFNMMDKRQLDDLFAALSLSPDDTVLDVGCGTGCLLNSIAEKFGCKGIGIDCLSVSIVNSLSPLIDYRQADMDEIDAFHAQTVLFVDSLYFSRDCGSLLSRLKGGAVKKAYLYYSAYLFEDTEDKALLRKDQTPLAQVLNRLGYAYKATDYSECEFKLYTRGFKLLEKYKSAFTRQGLEAIYARRLGEYQFGAELYEKGLTSRFLYIADKF